MKKILFYSRACGLHHSTIAPVKQLQFPPNHINTSHCVWFLLEYGHVWKMMGLVYSHAFYLALYQETVTWNPCFHHGRSLELTEGQRIWVTHLNLSTTQMCLHYCCLCIHSASLVKPSCGEWESPLAEWKPASVFLPPMCDFPRCQGSHGVRAGGFVVVVLENEKNKCSSLKVSVW